MFISCRAHVRTLTKFEMQWAYSSAPSQIFSNCSNSMKLVLQWPLWNHHADGDIKLWWFEIFYNFRSFSEFGRPRTVSEHSITALKTAVNMQVVWQKWKDPHSETNPYLLYHLISRRQLSACAGSMLIFVIRSCCIHCKKWFPTRPQNWASKNGVSRPLLPCSIWCHLFHIFEETNRNK